MLLLTAHGPAHAQEGAEAEEDQGLHDAAAGCRRLSGELLWIFSVVVLLSAGPGSIYMPAGHLFGLGQTHAVAQSSSHWLENQMSMLPLALVTTASP